MRMTQKDVDEFNQRQKAYQIGNRRPEIAKPEQSAGTPLAKAPQDQEGYSGRCICRFTQYRVRTLDPDNAVVKYHIDALRYAGVLREDTRKEVKLEIMPEIKVAHYYEERLEIDIIPI